MEAKHETKEVRMDFLREQRTLKKTNTELNGRIEELQVEVNDLREALVTAQDQVHTKEVAFKEEKKFMEQQKQMELQKYKSMEALETLRREQMREAECQTGVTVPLLGKWLLPESADEMETLLQLWEEYRARVMSTFLGSAVEGGELDVGSLSLPMTSSVPQSQRQSPRSSSSRGGRRKGTLCSAAI